MTAVIYARYSSDNQREESISIVKSLDFFVVKTYQYAKEYDRA